jgi:hypothetical protein
LAKVAVVFLAALVPLAAKVTAAGGEPMADQVYVSAASPSSSAPRTLTAVDMPVTGFALAAAGAATVGAPLGVVALAVAVLAESPTTFVARTRK